MHDDATGAPDAPSEPSGAADLWLRALDTADRGRIRQTTGLDPETDGAMFGSAPLWWERIAAAPPPVRAAVASLEATWPDGIAERQRSFLRRTLVPWGIAAFPREGGCWIHPVALVQCAARWVPDSDAAWVVRRASTPESAARAWLALRTGASARALDTTAENEVAPSVSLRRWLDARPLHDDAAAEQVEALADRVRGAALWALSLASDAAERVRFLHDAPRATTPLWWACQPAPLLLPARELLVRTLEPLRVPSAPSAWVEALASAYAEPHGGWEITPLAHLRASWWPALRSLLADVGSDAPSATAADVARWVVACGGAAERPERTTRELLVDAFVEGDGQPSWVDVARAAYRSDTRSVIESLWRERSDWDDFDAPGEGQLPPFWDAIVALSDAADPASASRAGAALVAFPSPAALGFERDDMHVSSLTSEDPHGRTEEIAEAYGDVWSPRDPFSERLREHALPTTPGAAAGVALDDAEKDPSDAR